MWTCINTALLYIYQPFLTVFLLRFCRFQNDLRSISRRDVMHEAACAASVAVVYYIIHLFIPCKLLLRFKGNNKEHLLILYARCVSFPHLSFVRCSSPRITNCDTKRWLTGALRGKLYQVNVPAGEYLNIPCVQRWLLSLVVFDRRFMRLMLEPVSSCHSVSSFTDFLWHVFFAKICEYATSYSRSFKSDASLSSSCCSAIKKGLVDYIVGELGIGTHRT